MAFRVLSQDVVALVHHVELAASGWRERLSEQLLLASLADRQGPQDVERLTHDISQQLGRTLSAAALTNASQRLIGRGLVVRSANQGVSLSQMGLAEVTRRREVSADLERRAKATFGRLAGVICPNLAVDNLWQQFTDVCLEPMVSELGARTYQFLAGASDGLGPVRSMSSFIDRFPAEVQPALKNLLDRFLTPSDRDVRDYVLQQLNAHFLSLAASLSDDALSSLTGRLRQAVQLRLFLDTNFLFSVLDLHDNPANDAARELVSLLKKLHGKLDYTLYVYPLTVDEARRTLAGYERTLTDAYLTPKLGQAALAAGASVSGLVLRYLRAVADAKERITARDFFAPYLNDLVSVLRSKGVELYNAPIEGLTTAQPVIDDILDQQAFEAQRYPDRAKSYEALRHDVALWHLVSGRRTTRLTCALDATYWIVTIDYRFLGFDAHKGKADPATLPVCVHPAVLLQMLQLWLPRDETLDKALLQGIRSLLPQVFDSQAEEATVRILTSLARYENVDDLPEDTIAQVLLSQALRDRIRSVDDVRQQVDLVREEIISQHAEAKAQLLAEQTRRTALEADLVEERTALAAASKRHEAQVDALADEEARLRIRLDRESADRAALEGRIASLEESLRRTSESHSAMQLTIFMIACIIAVGAAVAAGLLLPDSVAGVTGMQQVRAVLLTWIGGSGLAGIGIWITGRMLPTVRVSRWYARLSWVLKLVLSAVWAVFLGIVATYVWGRF